MIEEKTRQGPNSEEIEFWNGPAGQKWVDANRLLDLMLEPLGDLAMTRAAPAPGEHVLDIGCGCGTTTLDLARRVAPGGAVTGLEVSGMMVVVARERVESAAVPVRIVDADAEIHELPASSFDLVYSRFGVMFFANPVTAFANFLGVLKPGGRLVFVCWRDPELNPWLTVPFDSARHFAPDFEPPKSDVPFSAFALASREKVEAIFADSGFVDIRLNSHKTTLRLGEGDLDDCVDLVFKLGPISGVLAAADDADAPAITETVRTALAPYYTGNCIEMALSVWIASARRP